MHSAAYDWVARHARIGVAAVLDIGGRNLNGTVRPLFTGAVYTVLDIIGGEGVDIVADAATWQPDRQYDVVVCCEVFEHTKAWPAICRTAYASLATGGQFIATMAGPGRLPHSALDGGPDLQPGEWYQNVTPEDLQEVLGELDWKNVHIDRLGTDLRATATRGA